MNTQSIEPITPAPPFGVEQLRAELGLTQAEFGERVGLKNKASVSLIESGKNCSPEVALKIEALSVRDGIARIDAGDLNETVRKARAACPGGCMLGSALEERVNG